MLARRQVSDSEKRYLAGDSGNASSCLRSVFILREAFGPKPVFGWYHSSEASSASQHNYIEFTHIHPYYSLLNKMSRLYSEKIIIRVLYELALLYYYTGTFLCIKTLMLC